MAEEFIEDILASAATSTTIKAGESSSTAATSVDSPDNKVVETKPLDNDQSSKQSNTNNTTTDDIDQSGAKLSVEELATQLGWRADHVGEDAVDAATYILRSKDIQKSMSKHNKDLKEQLGTFQKSIDALKEHNEKVYKADIKRLQAEITRLETEKDAAIELADKDKVKEIDKQIKELEKDIEAPKVETKSGEVANPAFDKWIIDNQWYNEDQEMAAYADQVAQQYVGAPLDRIYALVRNKVQEVWPEKFEAKPVKKNAPVGPTSPVESATKKAASTGFSKADLNESQLSIMRQFVGAGIMTEEQYINDIAKLQAE